MKKAFSIFIILFLFLACACNDTITNGDTTLPGNASTSAKSPNSSTTEAKEKSKKKIKENIISLLQEAGQEQNVDLTKKQTQYIPKFLLEHDIVSKIVTTYEEHIQEYLVEYLPNSNSENLLSVDNYELSVVVVGYNTPYGPDDLFEGFQKHTYKNDDFYYAALYPHLDSKLLINYRFFFEGNECYVITHIKDTKGRSNEQIAEQLHEDFKCVVLTEGGS